MKNIIIVDMQDGFINDNNKHLDDRINTYFCSNSFFPYCWLSKQKGLSRVILIQN